MLLGQPTSPSQMVQNRRNMSRQKQDTRQGNWETEWVIEKKSSSRDGTEYRHGLTLIILSCLTAVQDLQNVQEKPVSCDQISVAELLLSATNKYKLVLAKHCFCPPVAANERDTEACDMTRLITPQSHSCKHFTRRPRSANRSHSPLNPLLLLRFHISCSLSHISVICSSLHFPSFHPWQASWHHDLHVLQALSLSYTCFFLPLKAHFSRQERERDRDTPPPPHPTSLT